MHIISFVVDVELAGEYKNLNTVKVFWKYLLNGDGYYFGWDEIIFSKQAARPFL